MFPKLILSLLVVVYFNSGLCDCKIDIGSGVGITKLDYLNGIKQILPESITNSVDSKEITKVVLNAWKVSKIHPTLAVPVLITTVSFVWSLYNLKVAEDLALASAADLVKDKIRIKEASNGISANGDLETVRAKLQNFAYIIEGIKDRHRARLLTVEQRLNSNWYGLTILAAAGCGGAAASMYFFPPAIPAAGPITVIACPVLTALTYVSQSHCIKKLNQTLQASQQIFYYFEKIQKEAESTLRVLDNGGLSKYSFNQLLSRVDAYEGISKAYIENMETEVHVTNIIRFAGQFLAPA